jgi:hypothetical protein
MDADLLSHIHWLDADREGIPLTGYLLAAGSL